MGRAASTTADDAPRLPAPAGRLRRQLLAWYDAARRRLPWRAEPGAGADPYAVLVSEVMLQQTTVAMVRGRFESFLGRFPDLRALAGAPLDEVLHAWQGLGYYRRARALHALAREVVERHGGSLPGDPAALAALPGLGPYTVAAMRAIAFGHAVLPVDGNIARLLARLAAVETPLPAALPELRRLAAALAGGERPGDLAQAAMELGALVCRPRRPACGACPWRHGCRALAEGEAEALPRRVPRPARPRRFAAAFLAVAVDGRLLLRRRPDDGLLGGLLELPTTPWRDGGPWPEPQSLAHAPAEARWRALPGSVRHVFTHLALELSVLRGEVDEARAGLWHPPERLHELALPTLTRKLLRHAGYRVA